MVRSILFNFLPTLHSGGSTVKPELNNCYKRVHLKLFTISWIWTNAFPYFLTNVDELHSYVANGPWAQLHWTEHWTINCILWQMRHRLVQLVQGERPCTLLVQLFKYDNYLTAPINNCELSGKVGLAVTYGSLPWRHTGLSTNGL